jgi:sugar lactone lactonase YvrE
MKPHSLRCSIAVCALAALLTACGGSQSPTGTAGALPSVRVAAPIAVFAAGPNLYVGNDLNVTVYAPADGKPIRTISKGIGALNTLAVRSGNLYAASGYAFAKLTVYRGGKTLVRTITKGLSSPLALAFGGSGNLFVANRGPSTVTVYVASSGMLVRKISSGVDTPEALGFDPSGNLYVDNNPPSGKKSVTIYAPSKGKPLRTIDFGIPLFSLALDASGNLYVATDHEVSVYTNAGAKLLRKISDGIRTPRALTFDDSGNLYVANTDAVTVYAKGSAKLLRRISSGINRPSALAFDASGNLYVANEEINTVTVYAPGSDKVLRTISQGLDRPHALAFGP